MITMEVWNEKSIDYHTLKVIKAFTFAYIKQDKANVSVVKYVFNGYSESVKSYKPWKMELGG